MDLVIDGRTMAVSTPSGVPVMDISLVLGDTVPVRIRVDHALTDCTPVLAVKQTIGSPGLVMTVTGWTREDDWQTASWVINTVPLQEALGSADSVALIAELVLVSPDGAQHTSRPIKVTVRRDILPAEFAPPAEVLADWHALVAMALSNQLPEALQEAGVNITPVTGSSTLSTGEAETPTVMACYALTWGDELLAGHLTDSCRLRRVTMTYYTDTGLTEAHWLRVWRMEGGKYVVAGVAAAVALPANNQPIAWEFTSGVPLRRGDEIMMEICTGTSAERLTTRGLGVHAVITPSKDGRGIAAAVSYPPEITLATLAPMMSVTVDYDEGISVGGVELATVTQVQSLGSDVRIASANSQAAAQSAATSRDQAQAAVAGLSIMPGTVTTGAPGSQAAITMTPGSTPGSWQLDMTIPRGDVGAVDTSQAYSWSKPQTYDATVTASRGVRVPLPATAQEALSYEALVEQQAADDWRRTNYYMDTLIPSWVTTLVRQMQMADAYNVGTANASFKEAVYTNDLHDFLVTMTPAAGVSLIGRSTGAWKFANYIGDHNNSNYAAAAVWRIIGSDKASILLGSTSQGYASTTTPAAPCYAHPIHWADYHLDAADYRYPLLNATNNYTSRDMAPAWQVTIYPTGYLGSTTSCIIRGTDYGRDIGDQLYMWALVPKITYVAVAMAPRAAADHRNTMNRWELFVDGVYVMPMTSLFCGSGHTACVTVKAKAHEASSTLQVGLRMGGMRIDAAPALGVNDVRSIMGRVVMSDATVKPVPVVEASALEVPVAGGEVTLTVSSTLSEAVYILNDTMCGHDPAAVWCTQSSEQTPAGGGQITLTVAPNTTGQPRQVWAFAGHHYGQATVVKINQLA